MPSLFAQPIVDQEYQVLGQQMLTELRDCIKCPCDQVIVGEFSENPDSHLLVPAKVGLIMFHYFVPGNYSICVLVCSMFAALMLCRTYTNRLSSTSKASSITISE